MTKISITENERKHYQTYRDNSFFESAEAEYIWADTQKKECNKCKKNLPLTCFGFSTSGSFPFNKKGYRYRRGNCLDCGQELGRGKNTAKKRAKIEGLPLKPPKGSKCKLCGDNKNLVFDHDHLTEKFRGWLCDPCNRAIGTIESRVGVNWLQKVTEYTSQKEVETEGTK